VQQVQQVQQKASLDSNIAFNFHSVRVGGCMLHQPFSPCHAAATITITATMVAAAAIARTFCFLS
jgi:hypothetical protein